MWEDKVSLCYFKGGILSKRLFGISEAPEAMATAASGGALRSGDTMVSGDVNDDIWLTL